MDAELLITERWLWLEISVALAVVAGWVRWAWRRSGRPVFPWMKALGQALALLYALGMPALVLFWRRLLSERFFGLKTLHAGPAIWMRDLAWMILVGVAGGWVLATLARTAPAPRQRDGLRALREALYHQVHVAFYREPFALLWGVGVGAWIGLALVLLEALLSPDFWTEWGNPLRNWSLSVRAALHIMGLIVYVQTQNLWLILLLDVCLLAWIGFPQNTES